jgi:hypothetical protein
MHIGQGQDAMLCKWTLYRVSPDPAGSAICTTAGVGRAARRRIIGSLSVSRRVAR